MGFRPIFSLIVDLSSALSLPLMTPPIADPAPIPPAVLVHSRPRCKGFPVPFLALSLICSQICDWFHWLSGSRPVGRLVPVPPAIWFPVQSAVWVSPGSHAILALAAVVHGPIPGPVPRLILGLVPCPVGHLVPVPMVSGPVGLVGLSRSPSVLALYVRGSWSSWPSGSWLSWPSGSWSHSQVPSSTCLASSTCLRLSQAGSCRSSP